MHRKDVGGEGNLSAILFIVREQVYSHGKLVLKASHWSRYVEGTLANMKNVVGNFVTRTGTIHGGLKHVSYNNLLAWK